MSKASSAIDAPLPAARAPKRIDARRAYRMIWRWHFYAGLFCVPFVIWLAVTGSIYLFRPDIEAWLDRPYTHLPTRGPLATPSARVAAAVAAVPGSVLHAYQLPEHQDDATQILVGRDGEEFRVYVHPETTKPLRIVREDSRPMRVLFHLHGELLLGDRGSMIVELAASWAIVLLLTGLYLWWPADAPRIGGVGFPRLRAKGRTFWRDLHAVTAVWVSLFALFLLVSGLPWAKSWGSLLREARQLGATHAAAPAQDWTTGQGSEIAARRAMDAPLPDAHAGHGSQAAADTPSPQDDAAIDAIVQTVAPLGLAAPVLIAPPSLRNSEWTARSDAANRPLRTNLTFDASGKLHQRIDFDQRPLIDRLVGYGVAAHEGQLFGRLNQALGVFTALGLILVAVSAVTLWWKRRPAGTLGAIIDAKRERLSIVLAMLIVALAIALPLLGVSLIVVMIAERFVLRRIPRARRFLGLSLPVQASHAP